jgi:hypothetical protein
MHSDEYVMDWRQRLPVLSRNDRCDVRARDVNRLHHAMVVVAGICIYRCRLCLLRVHEAQTDYGRSDRPGDSEQAADCGGSLFTQLATCKPSGLNMKRQGLSSITGCAG